MKKLIEQIKSSVLTQLNEDATYSTYVDYKHEIKEVVKYMLNEGYNILPLPKVKFIKHDTQNAKSILGKTAYYDPLNIEVVLYTEGRHPRDIVSSFCHEMVHHIQNVEDRLGNIDTQNVNEDDHLKQIEEEAYKNGGIIFRAYKDKIR